MRNHEQFKALVYAKAEVALTKRKKQRRVLQSGICAACVCICLVGILFSAPNGFSEKANDTYAYAGSITEANDALTVGTNQLSGALYDAVVAETATADDGEDATANGTGGVGKPSANILLNNMGNSIRYFTAAKSDTNTVNGNSGLVQVGCKDAPSAPSYEMYIDNASKYGALSHEEDNSANAVQVTVATFYLTAPNVSNITTAYGDGTVSITVFADSVPVPYGSYVYCFSKMLDSKKYFGQPIQVYFKTTAEKDAVKNCN